MNTIFEHSNKEQHHADARSKRYLALRKFDIAFDEKYVSSFYSDASLTFRSKGDKKAGGISSSINIWLLGAKKLG